MTKNSMALNRTLFLEDNLPVLRGLDTDSIDLIATDPPFNKGVGAFEGTTKAGVDIEFKDVWHWDDVQDEWLDEVGKKHPRLMNVIRYANDTAGNDMGAFLCWMAVRVMEMWRVLKPTGSIYLHCDPTASHYLKAMMDAIFERKNFRNEIVWSYTNRLQRGGNTFGRLHDTILYYAKSDTYVYNPVTDPDWSPSQTQARRLEKGWEERKGALIIYDDAKFAKSGVDESSYDKVYRSKASQPPIGDVWPVPILNPMAKERVGWPTQKPLAIYKRMIEASSNPGDIVLDPFAGCATTAVAAEQLGRQWIGIDIREESGDVILERLQREVSENMAWDTIVRMPKEAPARTDDGKPAAPDLVLESPKRNAPRIPVREVRARLELRDGLRCRGCGWIPPYLDYMHVDHRKPKKEGGETDMSNFVLLCEPCNRKKSYKMALRELQEARIAEGRMDMDWWEREGKW